MVGVLDNNNSSSLMISARNEIARKRKGLLLITIPQNSHLEQNINKSIAIYDKAIIIFDIIIMIENIYNESNNLSIMLRDRLEELRNELETINSNM